MSRQSHSNDGPGPGGGDSWVPATGNDAAMMQAGESTPYPATGDHTATVLINESRLTFITAKRLAMLMIAVSTATTAGPPPGREDGARAALVYGATTASCVMSTPCAGAGATARRRAPNVDLPASAALTRVRLAGERKLDSSPPHPTAVSVTAVARDTPAIPATSSASA